MENFDLLGRDIVVEWNRAYAGIPGAQIIRPTGTFASENPYFFLYSIREAVPRVDLGIFSKRLREIVIQSAEALARVMGTNIKNQKKPANPILAPLWENEALGNSFERSMKTFPNVVAPLMGEPFMKQFSTWGDRLNASYVSDWKTPPCVVWYLFDDGDGIGAYGGRGLRGGFHPSSMAGNPLGGVDFEHDDPQDLDNEDWYLHLEASSTDLLPQEILPGARKAFELFASTYDADVVFCAVLEIIAQAQKAFRTVAQSAPAGARFGVAMHDHEQFFDLVLPAGSVKA